MDGFRMVPHQPCEVPHECFLAVYAAGEAEDAEPLADLRLVQGVSVMPKMLDFQAGDRWDEFPDIQPGFEYGCRQDKDRVVRVGPRQVVTTALIDIDDSHVPRLCFGAYGQRREYPRPRMACCRPAGLGFSLLSALRPDLPDFQASV